MDISKNQWRSTGGQNAAHKAIDIEFLSNHDDIFDENKSTSEK